MGNNETKMATNLEFESSELKTCGFKFRFVATFHHEASNGPQLSAQSNIASLLWQKSGLKPSANTSVFNIKRCLEL